MQGNDRISLHTSIVSSCCECARAEGIKFFQEGGNSSEYLNCFRNQCSRDFLLLQYDRRQLDNYRTTKTVGI